MTKSLAEGLLLFSAIFVGAGATFGAYGIAAVGLLYGIRYAVALAILETKEDGGEI